MGQALRGEPLTVFGEGDQTRSFCYVDDLVDGIYRLFMHGDHQPVNIGNPAEITVQQLAEIVVELTGSTAPIVYEPLPQDDPKVRQPDITRARDDARLGAAGARREGLARTIEYFRELWRTAADGARVGTRSAPSRGRPESVLTRPRPGRPAGRRLVIFPGS